jgi:hypothetical protein
MSRALAEFGRWCLDRMRSPAPGDIDGGEAQEEAERLGLLVRVTCTEPCGEQCTCAEYHGEGPWECLRPAIADDDLDEAVDAAAAEECHGEVPGA